MGMGMISKFFTVGGGVGSIGFYVLPCGVLVSL